MMHEKKYRLGIVANLAPNGSVHQQTFVRAVNDAAGHLCFDQLGIELVWENDQATESGGKDAASLLVKKGVECVVGHYSSAAAKGALPRYEKKNIPLLLPAATADILTANFHSALRLCAKDSELALFIIKELKKRNIHRLYIEHDRSVHGASLAGNLVSLIGKENGFSLLRNISDAEYVLFAGTYLNSINFAQQVQHSPGNVQHIYFTDDLVHNDLATKLGNISLSIYVFGADSNSGNPDAEACVQRYREKWKTAPDTYYLETYAAMEVAAQLFEKAGTGANNLTELAYQHTWNTVLGQFRFTPEGESRLQRYAVWALTGNGLTKETILPEHETT